MDEFSKYLFLQNPNVVNLLSFYRILFRCNFYKIYILIATFWIILLIVIQYLQFCFKFPSINYAKKCYFNELRYGYFIIFFKSKRIWKSFKKYCNFNKYLKFIVNRSKHIFCSHYVFLKCMRPLNTTIVTTNVTFYDEHTLLLNDSMLSGK